MTVQSIFRATAVRIDAVAAAVDALDDPYHPTGMQWSCSPVDVGMDGGALQIGGNTLTGVENDCELSQPTPVRGMDLKTRILPPFRSCETRATYGPHQVRLGS